MTHFDLVRFAFFMIGISVGLVLIVMPVSVAGFLDRLNRLFGAAYWFNDPERVASSFGLR